MSLAIGIGLSPNLGSPRSRVSGGTPGAVTLLGAETNGFAVDWVDNSSCIRLAGVDIVSFATGFLVVTGSLASSANGATFNATNNAYWDMSGISNLATYRLTSTIYAEASVDAVDSTNKVPIGFSDSVSGNNSVIRAINASNLPTGIETSASVTTGAVSVPAVTVVAVTFYKMAYGAQLDNFDIAWNGVAGSPHDAAGARAVNPIRCYFGVAFGANSPLNGKIRRAMILPRKMTLAELQTKTT